MANALLEKGREGFLDGTLDWDTNSFKAALLDLNTADNAIKAIASSTNATPIVVTATAHGFTNGDLVLIGGHTTNTAANGIWQIAGVATNTFQLVRPDGTNSVGNGVGGATGYAVCLGPSASGDNWDDFDGAVIGTPQTLTSPTVTSGVADAADPTFSAVTGATVEAILIFKDTGTPSTSRVVAIIDGRHIVTVSADAASSATTLWVEALAAGIPNGTVLAFSNGVSATLTALAAQGARSLTVSAISGAIAAGNRADAPATGSNLPITPNGGNITVQFDNGASRVFNSGGKSGTTPLELGQTWAGVLWMVCPSHPPDGAVDAGSASTVFKL